ncbi:MAG: 3-deoxy-8-phosphooctulonate synthase [Candidatus Zipacnadales bacterium]
MSVLVQAVNVGGAEIGGQALALIAGPCVLEDFAMARDTAARLRDLTGELNVPFVFKASFDKANRTSLKSYRGPGLVRGLEMLGRIRSEVGVPVLSDVHEPAQVELAAQVLDMLQVPAFLCRQTDLLIAAGESGRPVNIKKGQFLAPDDMRYVVEKVRSTGNEAITLCERGSSFGYHNLVVDMRGLITMRALGYPVLFDATHSVQLPGGGPGHSGGERQFIAPLTRAAVAVGVDGIFAEVHPTPESALCDGPNMLPLDEVAPLLRVLLEVRQACQT